MWRIGDRVLPWGVQIDGGSDWVALSRSFVKYVARRDVDRLVEGLLVVFKHTLLPAESFFHTVIRNSRFCDTYIDNNLHVTNWKRKLGCKCQYKHVVDWCGCSPNDFKPEDWVRIQNTEGRQLFFARKFEPVINQAAILQLEQWLYGEDVMKNVINLNSYWQSVYSHLDLGQADDALLTVAWSAARVKGRNVCNATPSNVLEVTSYHKDDVYQKTLIFADYGAAQLEFGIKPKNSFSLLKSSLLTERLNFLVVSSDFDQKELVLRNFPRFLGPYSEPTLVHQFKASRYSTGNTYNISYLWIDPTGSLIETTDAIIEDTFIIAHVKPNLRQPLLPGVWTVKLFDGSDIVAEVQFLVTPLQFFGGNVVTEKQVGFINGGAGVGVSQDESYGRFLPDSKQRGQLERLARANAKRYGVDLEEWIDSLISEFYYFKEVCYLRESCAVGLQNCNGTSWSSFAPDPKSQLGQVNETSGRFDPW